MFGSQEGNIKGTAPVAQFAETEKPETEMWGLLTSIDLEDCDPDLIRSADAIKDFTARLCQLIKMKTFGPCHVVHFGEDEKVAGYSMFQLIETSCISAHFANQTNRMYLDVFSCKMYDSQLHVFLVLALTTTLIQYSYS